MPRYRGEFHVQQHAELRVHQLPNPSRQIGVLDTASLLPVPERQFRGRPAWRRGGLLSLAWRAGQEHDPLPEGLHDGVRRQGIEELRQQHLHMGQRVIPWATCRGSCELRLLGHSTSGGAAVHVLHGLYQRVESTGPFPELL